MEQPADQPSVLAQFTPSLRVERFDEVVQYDDAMTAKPPQRTYEKVWQGRCGPDFTVEDGEDKETVRPVRLRVRWLQNGDATPRWNSIEVTGQIILPDGCLRRLLVREIWTHYHAELGQIPDWLLQFVSTNPPATRTTTQV
ncbi:hypothetical protein [Streptomyces sp. NPDC057302]|uniref:hypothetical protein n=1 Tax=Streptomyces sp. NPDC057302 TaxID=3346094 RepID=UPI00362AB6A1